MITGEENYDKELVARWSALLALHGYRQPHLWNVLYVHCSEEKQRAYWPNFRDFCAIRLNEDKRCTYQSIGPLKTFVNRYGQ